MDWRVPLFNLNLGDAERHAVQAVMDSGWLTMGEEVLAFEREFAAFTGAGHAVAVANCTAAIHLTLKALDVGPGDEVICPALNFCAGPNVIVVLGAKVIFADISSHDDLCLSPIDVEARITSKTKAVMVMHYAGYPCDMDAFRLLTEKHGLLLVEDAAHAPGAGLGAQRCGTLSRAACFSFYSNKNLTTGEGGMITTGDRELAERLRLLRSHGMTTSTLDRHKGHAFDYDLSEPGFNYRIDEMRAAVGRVQLSRLGEFNERRKMLNDRYRANLSGVNGIFLPFNEHRGTPAYHIRPILLEPGIDRKTFMAALRNEGIQTSIHYPPIHGFRWYRNRYPGVMLPVTEDAAARLVTLPLYSSMSEEAVDLVCDAVIKYCKTQDLQ